jgi:hypothetical protein
LAGCSESRVSGNPGNVAAHPSTEAIAEIRPATTAPATTAPATTAPATTAPAKTAPAKTEIGKRFATAALDDRQLGNIRGGLNTGSGVVVNFSFQEATYVNHNLTQSIIVPTMTFSPGSNPASAAATGGSASAISGIASTAQTQVSAPTQVVQSVVNNGMTSIVSSVGGSGVTSHISNTANNQLIQQMITANIGISGLGQAIQQGVASTVMSRIQAANAQFR